MQTIREQFEAYLKDKVEATNKRLLVEASNKKKNNAWEHATQFWQLICKDPELRRGFPVPAATETSDNLASMIWRTGRFTIQVEIYPDGSLEWFGQDSRSTSYVGCEDPVALDDPELWAWLRKVATAI